MKLTIISVRLKMLPAPACWICWTPATTYGVLWRNGFSAGRHPGRTRSLL